MIAETPQAVTSLLETLWAMGQDIILQQYIAEAKGRDLRAIVVGGRVIASMRRQAKAGEFRSNLHRGGLGVRAPLPDSYRRAAVAATRVMGLEVAGVDMLETREGPKILEINSSPGLEGIERASGIDVAGAIIVHAERYLARRGRRRSKLTLDDERRLSRLRANGVAPRRARRSTAREGWTAGEAPGEGARRRATGRPGADRARRRRRALDHQPARGEKRLRLPDLRRAARGPRGRAGATGAFARSC